MIRVIGINARMSCPCYHPNIHGKRVDGPQYRLATLPVLYKPKPYLTQWILLQCDAEDWFEVRPLMCHAHNPKDGRSHPRVELEQQRCRGAPPV
eukprot:scaffold1758_cov333-Pavlova_lutheri.AAC.6